MEIPVLLFFNISGGELIIILLVAFVVFGPNRIPEIARKIGRGLNEVRRASDEIKREITKETNNVKSSLSVDDMDLTSPRRKADKPQAKDTGKKFPDQTSPSKEDKKEEENPPAGS